MKTIKLSFLLLVFLFLTFIHTSAIQSQGIKNKFYVGFQGANLYPEYYSQYDDLKVNSTVDWGFEGDYQDYPTTYIPPFYRLYGGFFDQMTGAPPPLGHLPNGYLTTLLDNMQRFYNGVYTGHTDKPVFLFRSAKVVRPAFGQRSTYQAEFVGSWDTTHPGYGYMKSDCGHDTTETINGETVTARRVNVGRDNTGYIVDSLFENAEQTSVISRLDYGTANYSDVKFYGQNGNTEAPFRWFVKPRMRIDTTIAHNPIYANTLVATIEIYNFRGGLIKSVPIKVSNFKSDSLGYLFSKFYHGEYIEMYNFEAGSGINLNVTGLELSIGADSTNYYSNKDSSKVDYKVKWNGHVDVWLDYVRLDDEWAHYLFTNEDNDPLQGIAPGNRWAFYRKLKAEVEALAGTGGLGFFYFDEFYYNNIDCLAKVNDLVKQYSSAIGHPTSLLIQAGSRSPDLKKEPSVDRQLNTLKTKGLITDGFIFDKYPIYWQTPYPANLPIVHHTKGNSFYPNPSPTNSYYNQELTKIFDGDGYLGDLKRAANILKTSSSNPIFISTVQTHSLETNMKYVGCVMNNNGYEFRREPTNEEINVQAYIMLCYGAKQIDFYNHTTVNDTCANGVDSLYDWGVTEVTHTLQNNVRDPRISNYYGQNKFQNSAELNAKLLKMGRYMYDSLNLKFDDAKSYSADVMNGTYIDEIQSIYRNNQLEFLTANNDVNKYWQFGFFNRDNSIEPNSYSKYFIAVNRRCAPEDENANGDIRDLRIKFRASNFADFNNWNVVDALKDSVIATFDKNAVDFVRIGKFEPGEGRLFKLVPVLVYGGTFVGNESVKDISFTCAGMVKANNHDLTLKGNMIISFANTAGISMGSGKFYCGVDSTPSLSPSTGLHLVSLNSKWQGIVFGGTSEVKISNTEIKEVNAVSSINNGYSLTIQNPTKVRISKCKFTNSATDTSGAGAINVQYLNTISSPSIDILDNEINIGGNIYDAVTINAYSGMALSPYIRWNRITKTSSSGGGIGIAFLNLTGGTVRNNTITNAKYGMYVYHSTVNLWRNTITSSVTASRNLWALGITTLNMQPSAGTFLGGENTLSNTTDSRCIHIEDAFFNINGGYNNFKLTSASERHLYGYMPTSDTIRINALKNCFSIDNTNITDTSNIRKYVIWGNSTKALFNFYSFSCGDGEPAGCTSTSLDGDIRDTTWNNCDISMNENNSEGLMAGGKSDNPGYEKLYNDINLNIQKREFAEGVDNCKTLLEQFTDSIQTLDVVGKLFYCVVARNPNENELTALKSYYESFILNHSENAELTAEIFYYIQKTKAKLRDYESAMQGFETIMSQFPTTYMGLLARWDYMATHLLDSLSGQGGGMKDHEAEYTVEQEQERLFNRIEDPKDKYDKKKFTKEDRKVIVNNVVKSFITKKDIEIKKVKNLEEKVTKNIATSDEKNELKKVNKLKEIVKPQRVNTLIEHVNAIRNDVRQFADLSSEKDDNVGKATIIPFEYKLNQNYPNPFNPSTKINYELKNTGFVSLKIYDLLGREIAELVNETKEAGRYTVDFNASKYMMASGIYFYRIIAGEFVDTKRMVLIK